MPPADEPPLDVLPADEPPPALPDDDTPLEALPDDASPLEALPLDDASPEGPPSPASLVSPDPPSAMHGASLPVDLIGSQVVGPREPASCCTW